MAFLLSLEGVSCCDLDAGAEVFAALGQPVLVHAARPSWDQVQQVSRGVVFPSGGVHDAGEVTWATSASVLVVPHASHRPPAPAPQHNGQDHQIRRAGTA